MADRLLRMCLLASVGCLSACGDTSVGCHMDGPCPPGEMMFDSERPGEAFAIVTIRCDDCAWEVAGREAVMWRITLDGRYVQHLPASRPGLAEYGVMLGAVMPGRHTVRVEPDAQLTAPHLAPTVAQVHSIGIEQVPDGDETHRALSLAPFIYARPDTVGRFTDIPLLMWYEVEPAPRGTRYRYSVIFSHEDGGTPADRLMATWGRTTDIEYLYSVEVDEKGRVLSDDYQGPAHEVLAFTGRREAAHPLLWVVTDNNMVLDRGETTVRFAPMPVPLELTNVSREVAMDRHPWLYAVTAKELAREGRIDPDAPPGVGRIPDTRRFVHVEGCGEVGDVALTFGVRTADGAWTWADRGRGYGIARDGCFRGAVPLPARSTQSDVKAIGVRAIERSGRAGTSPARLTRINQAFMLDDRFVPGRSIATWQGSIELRPGGTPLEVAVK